MSKDFMSTMGDLKGYIEESLKFWKVPGVAVAIVKDGKVVLAEGYGYKDLKNKKKMTADTLLPIGSSTKPFTAMAAAILVDEGKLNWDTPVNEYIPGFKMYNPVASSYVSTRDMLCHRTGLPRHDLMWAGGTGLSFTREDLIRRVRYLENNAQFREKAQYQNHMFATVGHTIEKITGKSWEDYVKAKILKPLGMKNTNFHVADSQKAPDYALPYRKNYKADKIEPATFMELGAPGPAGSINSSVNEMTNWIKLLLGKGAIGKTRVVSEERMAEMFSPQMHIQLLPFEIPETHFLSYGLGWCMDIYRGHKCVHHGGNVTGFTASVTLLPEHNLGMCILANMNSTMLPTALSNEIYDRYLGVAKENKIDWNGILMKNFKELYAKMEEGKAAAAKTHKKNTKPTHDLKAYEGVYEHPGYGSLTVAKAKGKGNEGLLSADFNGNVLRLTHHHYDQFNLNLDSFDSELLTRFNLSATGDVESISVPFEGALGKDIVFDKKPKEAKPKKPPAKAKKAAKAKKS